MRHLILLILLACPGIFFAQDGPDLIFQNILIKALPGHVDEFESALAAHNKKYHPEGPHGCRVYSIGSGQDIGSYIWTMGPTTWAALDSRPSEGGHDEDWASVMAHAHPPVSGQYWRFRPQMSHFPGDFDIKLMRIVYIDIKPGHGSMVANLLDKVNRAWAATGTKISRGVYWNAAPDARDNRDVAVIFFYDSWGQMESAPNVVATYEEMHGDGSWDIWMSALNASVNETGTEFWNFREDLSGMGARVVAAQRQ